MSLELFADPFTDADQSEMAGLHCGDEPWARAATAWITGSDVLDSIRNYGTRAWIYRDSNDAIVGFGSLGPSQRRWPPPDGGYTRMLMIPQLGIDAKFRGKPPDPIWRYSHQIMEHLLAEANDWAEDIRKTKPARKHVELLMLFVHRDNVAAQRLYEKYEFVALPHFESKDHIVMSQRLASCNASKM